MYELVVDIYTDQRNLRELAISDLQFGLNLLLVGDLRAAEQRLWSGVRECREAQRPEYLFLAQEMLVLLYTLEGRDEHAKEITKAMADLPITFNRVETKAMQHLRKREFEDALACARQGLELARKTSEQMVTIRAKCLLGSTLARYARANGVSKVSGS